MNAAMPRCSGHGNNGRRALAASDAHPRDIAVVRLPSAAITLRRQRS